MNDDLPFYHEPLTEANPAAAPKRCRRHEWMAVHLTEDGTFHIVQPHYIHTLTKCWPGSVCTRCWTHRDEARAKRGKSSRRLGHDQERRAEKLYGWEKVGEYGGIVDLQGTMFKAQQKASRRAAPPQWVGIFRALDTVNDGRTPVLLLSFVKQGVPVEDFVVVRGRDWLALHGRDNPE